MTRMAIGQLWTSKQMGIDRPNWVGCGNKMRSGMTWREGLIHLDIQFGLHCARARSSLQQKSECKKDDTARHETTRDETIRHGTPQDGIGVGSREHGERREDEETDACTVGCFHNAGIAGLRPDDTDRRTLPD